MEETLLSVGIDTGAASPQTGQPVWGPHVMFASSAEVNSVCGKSPRCVDFTGMCPPRRAGARGGGGGDFILKKKKKKKKKN